MENEFSLENIQKAYLDYIENKEEYKKQQETAFQKKMIELGLKLYLKNKYKEDGKKEI